MLCGLDLSKCTQWMKFCSFVYDDDDGGITTSVVFLPDVWNIVPDEIEYNQMKDTYLRKWTVSSSVPRHPESSSNRSSNHSSSRRSSSSSSSSSNQEKDNGLWEKMKVTELRAELLKWKLPTKGVKSVLIARLQEAAALNKKKSLVTSKESAHNQTSSSSSSSSDTTLQQPPPSLPETRCQLILRPTRKAISTYGNDLTHRSETLATMLEKKEQVKERSSFETHVVMRMFDEMLQRRFAENIYTVISDKKQCIISDKKVDEPQRFDILSSLRYFDTCGSGRLDRSCLERMIHYTGRGVSLSKVNDLLSVLGKNDEYKSLWS